jgi:hypothetical protein
MGGFYENKPKASGIFIAGAALARGLMDSGKEMRTCRTLEGINYFRLIFYNLILKQQRV